MRRLTNLAQQAAPSELPVLITGETGTGKEVLARFIHSHSGRPRELFAPYNCTSMPADLVDAQLFGHRRGAFTGAHENALGVVRSVHGGTLLLDEIGDIDPRVQPKLLRLIESREVHPVGESRPSIVDVRILATTNADLAQRVQEQRFRKDLFYRLNIVHIHIPPLRERRRDVPPLVRYFLHQFATRYSKQRLQMSGDAMEALMHYPWPGNVRQLVNEMHRLVVLATGGTRVTTQRLPFLLHGDGVPAPAAARETVTLSTDQPLAAALQEVERALIVRALDTVDGRVTAAANRLGISLKTLRAKRRRLKIEPVP